MTGLRYIEGVATLKLDTEKCNGCMLCTMVCPHGVFEVKATNGDTHLGVAGGTEQATGGRTV